MDPLLPTEKQEFLSRLETVKNLDETDFETYAIVKDRENGQHYLRYSFTHINLSEGGRKDEFDHFLPLASDDVLAILFGEQPYQFPDQWKRAYLRSGTDDRLMPFDPSENHDLEKDAEAELALLAKLQQFKRKWEDADDKEALTRDLFRDLDEIIKKTDE
ncbi:hypothetical protein KDJ56_13640 [Brevibacillus composti]|uniref:Uncharacterized protein n=1 Tax=Brevibacillus composti TaxID=2796470 RepID=A0A7T5EI62_9BACL|nr:hypothetical protein [Brevibacillus composti]QQE72987.1 hypothetical protein JD108_13695 [Brevibacillus composti]QUO40065.1 hypothetical protein KDJ56_13640 [Brevibacillus composti]